MLNKHIYLSKENIQCQKLKLLVHCFLLRILSFFQRNASCNIGISKGRVALFAPNRHIQQSEKHMCPTTENLLGQKLKHQHIVYLLQLNLFQKGIFPKQQNFQGDARVILFRGLLKRVDITHVSLKENHPSQKRLQLAHCFLWRIQLVRDRNIPADDSFHRKERFIL